MPIEVSSLVTKNTVDNTDLKRGFQEADQITTNFATNTSKKLTGQSLFKGLLTGSQSGQAVFAQLEQQAQTSAQKMAAIFQGASASFLKGLSGGLGLGGGIFGLIEQAGTGLANMVKGGVALNQQIERSTVLFTTLSGNAQEAASHIADLQRYSLKTGVDLPQLLQGSERLQVFGFKLKDTTLLLHAATDQAALFGNSAGTFDRIVQALGLLAETGTVANRQITQLERQGVPAFKYLAEATGQSVDKLKEWEKLGILRGDVAARMISEGIERHNGGVAEQMAQNTGYGLQDATTNALALQAARGTTAITGALKTAYGDAFAALSGEGATAFSDNINKFTGGIFSLLETSVKAVSTGEFATLLESIGKNAMDSLWGGLSSVGSKLYDAGKNAANFIIGGTQDGLQSHSPSKVMLDIGYNAGISLLTGFDNALQQQTDHVLSKVGDTLDKIADRFKVPVESLMQANPELLTKLQQWNPDRLPVTQEEIPSGTELAIPTSRPQSYNKPSRRSLDASGSLGDRAANEALLDNPQVQAFLALIRQFEAGNDYASKFGGGEFTGGLNQSTFPFSQARTRTWSPTLGKYVTTSAEGGYQFEPQTWQNVAQANSLSDISPRNQDIGAVSLLRARGALPDVMSGDLMSALRKVADEWEIFKVALTQKPELLDKMQTFYGQSGVASAPQTTQPRTQSDGLIEYYQNLVKQLTAEEAQLNDKLGKSGDYFATLNGQQRGLDVQFAPQTAKLVDDLKVVRDGLKKAQEKLAQLEQQQREQAAKTSAPEISIPTEWTSVSDFISQINPSGESGVLPSAQLGSFTDTLQNVKALFPDVVVGAKGFTQSMIDLGVDLPPVMQDMSKLNDIAQRSGQSFHASADQAKASTDELAQFSRLASKDLSGVFTSSFDDAFQQTNKGFKAMVETFVVDFAQGVARMIEQAEAAKLAKMLFGTDDDDSGGGGWLSGLVSFIGKLLGGGFGGGASSGGGGGGGFDGFVEGAARGGFFNSAPGGQLIRVAEAGHPEVVLTTDPAHRSRTAGLMSDFISRTNIIPSFAMGGWSDEPYFSPSYSPNYQNNSSQQVVHHHHYEINIHHQTRSGYMQPPDRVEIVNRLANAITQKWR